MSARCPCGEPPMLPQSSWIVVELGHEEHRHDCRDCMPSGVRAELERLARKHGYAS